MIRLMQSHEMHRRACDLLEEVLTDVTSGASDFDIAARLGRWDRTDVAVARRLVDQFLRSAARPMPIDIAVSGHPLRDWLRTDIGVDDQVVRRLLTFVEEYSVLSESLEREPTIPEVAEYTQQSVATTNRRLAEFRTVFPGEDNPLRIGRVLRDALNDQSLWSSIDESLEATIGDVPVVQHVFSGDTVTAENKW